MNNTEPKINNLYLFGAGFTKAVFDDAPFNDELLEKLISRYPQSPLVEYQCRYHARNIEVILTRLDLETVDLQSERLKQDRQKINSEIAEYFQQFRWGRVANTQPCEQDWLERFAMEVFKPKDAIISLNYDCFLEGLLDYHKMWSPINGYPSSINVGNYNGRLPENPEGIIIYKIHGSENFRLHKTNVSPVLNGELFESYKNRSYSQIHPTGPYIIAPSFVKIPHEDIERMMIEVLDVADKAKNFIIIGCGMRPEDTFLWLLLTTFLYRPDKNGRIIIVDPYADSTKEKINCHYWGGDEVTNVVEIKGELQKEDILDELLKVVSKQDSNNKLKEE